MSARRIRLINEQKMTKSQHYRHDAVTRKREERALREQHRRERKIESYLADDDNFPSFKLQLMKISLQLRDIPGDGNCLFRALGDQLEGHGRNHFKHRFDVAEFMEAHRDDFEPFVEDDVPFTRHIQNLRKIGTYAGNDAIVAFARLYQVNVIIHQLNSPFLLIQGQSAPNPNARQIHIAYHNGDHYSSVRKLNDNIESPANIRLKVDYEADKPGGKPSLKIKPDYNTNMNGHCSGGVVAAVRDEQSIEDEVMSATGCTNEAQIKQTLLECAYDIDLAISQILQLSEMGILDEVGEDRQSQTSQQTSADSGIFSSGPTPVHSRDNSFGGSSGYGSLSSATGNGARPKILTQKVSAKQKKEVKKLEKKKRAEERHKMRIVGVSPQDTLPEDDNSITVVSKDIAMMKI